MPSDLFELTTEKKHCVKIIKMFDLFEIQYFLVLEDTTHDRMSPLQGFSHALPNLHWAMGLLSRLPADVFEPSQPSDVVISQRIGGERQLVWMPIDISSLEHMSVFELGVFTVCFSGDESTAKRVEAWIAGREIPIYHLRLTNEKDFDYLKTFTIFDLRDYCREAFDAQKMRFSSELRIGITNALEAWQEPVLLPTDHPHLGHNIFLPNQMVLGRAFRDVKVQEPWIGRHEKDYSEGIVQSVRSVMALRDEVGYWNFHRMSLPTPALILAEPALYRYSYKGMRMKSSFNDPIVKKTLRFFQTQKGLCNRLDETYLRGLKRSPEAWSIVLGRRGELMTFTLAVGLRAASTSAAVMRLSPGVNHVFSKLANYARHVRSDKSKARLKSRRLFKSIQQSMADAIGPQRMELLREEKGPMKIVSDCPLEWLEVDGLPLSLARDCSRITATPGNVMVFQLLQTRAMDVSPKAFERPLVVSSFAKDDPLRDIMHTSLQALRASDIPMVDYDFRRVSTVDEFIDTLNAYEGAILVFDGHGVADDPIGSIIIGGEEVDIWQLGSKVKVPPIVILSACDTQAVDARSHATVGNGFLKLGAKTVVATLLPVEGRKSALFTARLLLRLKDFLPAALKSGWRALNWTEVVSGMLRITLVTEILHEIVGMPATELWNREDVRELHARSNSRINSGRLDWYDLFLSDLAKFLNQNESAIRCRASRIIARSEAIRYIQLGNPEMIRIVDHHVTKELESPA